MNFEKRSDKEQMNHALQKFCQFKNTLSINMAITSQIKYKFYQTLKKAYIHIWLRK